MATNPSPVSGAKVLRLDIAVPERLLVSEEVDLVIAPGREGEFGVLPGHSPFLSSLRQGAIRYQRAGRATTIEISGGFAHVANDRVIILADSVVSA